MYDEAIVLEIKSKYALAMKPGGEVIRIHLKPDLCIGDKIYVLPEDLYCEQQKENVFSNVIPLPVMTKKDFQKNLRRIVGIAAAFFICFSMFFFKMSVMASAYAVISIDSANSVQLELDENYNIIGAISLNQSVSQQLLDTLIGKSLSDLTPEIYQMVGNGTVLIGYASIKNNGDQELLRQKFEQFFDSEKVLLLGGDTSDIRNAKNSGLSLGSYLAGKLLTEDELEDTLDDLSVQVLFQMFKNDPKWMSIAAFKEALEDKLDDARDELDEPDKQEDCEDDSDDASLDTSDDDSDTDDDDTDSSSSESSLDEDDSSSSLENDDSDFDSDDDSSEGTESSDSSDSSSDDATSQDEKDDDSDSDDDDDNSSSTSSS